MKVHSHDSQVGSVIGKEVQPKKVDPKLLEAAENFESLFLNLVLQQMRKTVPKEGLIDGGNAEDIYRSMLDQEYAKMMSAQKMTGLSEKIVDQLASNRINNISIGKNDALKNYSAQMKMTIGSRN